MTLNLTLQLKIKCDIFNGLAARGSYWYMYIQSHVQLSPFSSHTHSKCFLLSLTIRPKLRKSQVHRMTSKWPWMLNGQNYPIYVELLPTCLKFTPFCSTVARLPDNLSFSFLHRLQCWIWNFGKKIVKNEKLKSFKKSPK